MTNANLYDTAALRDNHVMRFRLRTLLIVFLILVLSAPWWENMHSAIYRWLWPHAAFANALYEVEDELKPFVEP